jgi:hypothetical protein
VGRILAHWVIIYFSNFATSPIIGYFSYEIK